MLSVSTAAHMDVQNSLLFMQVAGNRFSGSLPTSWQR